MTDTRTVPVADLLESLDFQPPCGADKCDQPASWVARMVCCGFMDLYCNDHHVMGVRFIAASPALHCAECQHNFLFENPIIWEPIK